MTQARIDINERVTQRDAKEVQLKQAVDRLADIERELDTMNATALINEAKILKDFIRGNITGPDNETIVIDGYFGHVEFGPVPQQRVVTRKDKLKRLLGVKLFDQLATFSMGVLEDHLPNKVIATVVETRPGTRPIRRAWIEDQVKH